ncbi:GH92 family glycosyl hydrolase [Luteimonas sp. S4-F44]|uniref:GH92 family glycosyl hydrolase n=1 Tax=Luteimonas sp. S4-F44 TaxID=2925842 RepID=UPI001F53DEE7|nr:GH92 family glycosyl hydrolase [Luteimonas sp. S4-F44]UNK42797.1 GH92 family glycosyl hydrolase [Luteimonas sp. S4-F44]
MARLGAAMTVAMGALLGAGVALADPGTVGDKAYGSVDPFIGTGGEGHTYPGATVPFGMVQLSPDTRIQPREKGYDWAAGYRYDDTSIVGFSHTHFSGTGHSDLGDVLLMPTTGPERLERGDPDRPGSGYTSRFRHDDEVAHPGYYAVTLDDYRVRAELTASARAGVHRYTFPAGEDARVLLDLRTSMYEYPGKILWSRLRRMPDGTITGFRETRGWAPGRQLYFAMRFSRPLQGHAFHNTETDILYKGFAPPADRSPGERAQIEGRQLVGTFDFGKLDAPLVVKVAISSVDEAGAIANLEAEVPDFDFDRVHAEARAQWTQALSVLDIDAPEHDRRSAYTALYHTLLGPTLFMDVDGRYRGPDQAVHTAEGFAHYSTFSLWDTYRALHPLLTIVQPEKRNADFIDSLLAHRRHSPYGILPVWSFHGQETWTMIGYHAVPVIADAYLKGIRGFDADAALEAMTASASYGPYDGLRQYMELGWVPIDEEGEAASKTLEYAYGDWTIARMAQAMGREDVARDFTRRAGNWRNAFDPATGFMRARNRDGSFRVPFDPTASGYGTDYTEGNAWQYSWYVPHDVAGLAAAHGGADALLDKLDAVFEADVDPAIFEHMEDITGLIGWYAHGNEPSHHVAYLYAYAGQPWRTQARLGTIMASQYADRPDGLAGNDDLGQMSAWYLFTALGFYPVAPGSGEYVIGRPFLPRAALDLPNGKRFTIVADGLAEGHGYIGAATLNGQPLRRAFLRHDEILAGGELRFTMQATPNRDWPGADAEAPYSMSTAPAR